MVKQKPEENKDEITALQIIYSKPYGKRHLTYEEIREVAEYGNRHINSRLKYSGRLINNWINQR